MSTALYRRYRPDTFAQVIGQDHVTVPLRAALKAQKVSHAYLFSGPRGCGKTTSARILARCLNCVEFPTDTPCGRCESCIELATGGPGSLDVVEIDAASHNGVDDARELRERAAFAPVRDRFKIFILDEAHMVTSAGFNALLKLVEEPPEHVKFIFATTEPEKVISTIRSRTHHYPFRLVPPEAMESYLGQLCQQEGIIPEGGVLGLVMRAGGGSVRDTLSVLDQLMAGSDGNTINYQTAVHLLGYTDASLLDQTVDALAGRDGAAAFRIIERVVESGHDPRRFAEDLLQRLRDLLLLAVTHGDDAALAGVPTDQIERMRVQSQNWGGGSIAHAADLVSDALTQMAGATSPRLQLELLIARILLPTTTPQNADTSPIPTPAGSTRQTVGTGPRNVTDGKEKGGSAATNFATASVDSAAGVREMLARQRKRTGGDSSAAGTTAPMPTESPVAVVEAQTATSALANAAAPKQTPHIPEAPAPANQPSEKVGENSELIRQRWADILGGVERQKRSTWARIQASQVGRIANGELLLLMPNERMSAGFNADPTHGQVVAAVIHELLGMNVQVRAIFGRDTDHEDEPHPFSDGPETPRQQEPAHVSGPQQVASSEWPVVAQPPAAPQDTASLSAPFPENAALQVATAVPNTTGDFEDAPPQAPWSAVVSWEPTPPTNEAAGETGVASSEKETLEQPQTVSTIAPRPAASEAQGNFAPQTVPHAEPQFAPSTNPSNVTELRPLTGSQIVEQYRNQTRETTATTNMDDFVSPDDPAAEDALTVGLAAAQAILGVTVIDDIRHDN
ncbi:MAG: DNA polymerase III subunit gamma and tau [Actinomycetaceae bacterium]|nr:DNA polymerase III subunit gamma and tau [Actinomycetaceae bacterium]